MPLRRALVIFIFRFIFPAPQNPQAASSAPAARWRDPSQKRKRKLVQPAGTEEIKPRPPPSPPRRRRATGSPPPNVIFTEPPTGAATPYLGGSICGLAAARPAQPTATS